MCLTSKSQ